LINYIDEHRDQFGVEPIYLVLREHGLQTAPSTYRAATKRPPSARKAESRAALSKYPDELTERAMRMAVDAHRDPMTPPRRQVHPPAPPPTDATDGD